LTGYSNGAILCSVVIDKELEMKFVKCYACDGRHDINFIKILETKEIKYSGTSVKFKCPDDNSEQINNSFVFEVKEAKTA
jgi:hypothetical protein